VGRRTPTDRALHNGATPGWTRHYAFGSGTSINQGGYARRDEALARLLRHVLIHLETNVRRAEQRREAVREAQAAAGLLGEDSG
jgi:hypothetical protein